MNVSLLELFQRGGLVMWPILFCSILALAIVIERLLALAKMELDAGRLMEGLLPAVRQRQLDKAERLCEAAPTPLSRMAKAGLKRAGRPREELREAMEETADLEAPALERHIPILGTIAHLTPLLGLLGTVVGLVRCFQVIQEKATSVTPVNPGNLAGGIWEALLTTVFGLMVAIPAYAMYNYLVYRINQFNRQMEAGATELADLLMPPNAAPKSRTASGQLETAEIIHG